MLIEMNWITFLNYQLESFEEPAYYQFWEICVILFNKIWDQRMNDLSNFLQKKSWSCWKSVKCYRQLTFELKFLLYKIFMLYYKVALYSTRIAFDKSVCKRAIVHSCTLDIVEVEMEKA